MKHGPVPLPETTVSLLARLQGAGDGSTYLFLSVERLKTIAIEREAQRETLARAGVEKRGGRDSNL